MSVRRPLTALVVALLLAPAAASADSGGVGVTGLSLDPFDVAVTQTSVNLSQHLTPLADLHFANTPPPSGTPIITVQDSTPLQRIQGFGAAMTDSSAWLIENKLAPAARNLLMGQLFGQTGIDLDFVRVPVGATDFTVGGHPYSYDDISVKTTDLQLRHFSIAHDRPYILPALAQVRAADPATEFLASPWTPPAWMKGNRSLGNVRNKGTLRGIAYGPWAAYIVRFIQAYAQAGIPISALTPQNEPGNPTSYPGLNMSSGSLANWIIQDLVPALQRAKLRTTIYGQDIGWGSPGLAQAAITSRAAPDLAGLAWHCYFGSPTVMGSLHQQAPAYTQIVDECSPGISAIPTSEVVISSLRDWASTVALWNLALDPKGGPVQAPNTGCPRCYGLATINESTGGVRLTRAYYQLGQASASIQPGARRVNSNHFVAYSYLRPNVNFVSSSLDDVAVVNPDGSRVLLAYDNGSQAITFAVDWHGSYFRYTIPPGATVTFKWDRPSSG